MCTIVKKLSMLATPDPVTVKLKPISVSLKPKAYSPPEVDRIWGIWESEYNIPKAIFHLLKGDYTPDARNLNPKPQTMNPTPKGFRGLEFRVYTLLGGSGELSK